MNQKSYNTVLFDFDGTLFDSWPSIYDAYVATHLHFYPGKDCSHIANIRNRHNDYKATFKEVFRMREIDMQIEKYLHQVYLELSVHEPTLFPGVQEAIQFIEKEQYRWGIVTSKKKHFTEQILANSPLSKTYECLICEEDVTHKKPHPEPLLKACTLLNITPNNAIYVGDSITDIEASQACGMDSVLALYGYLSDIELAKKCGANYFISDIAGLLPILR